METNVKLNEITTEYSKFNANQVLTEKQLNAFIDYFDDQDRLSRVGLSGVGLACGFQVIPLFNSDKTAAISLTISQGTAVTTDGDYVQFFDLITKNKESKKFSFYKKFEDDNANYDRFLDSQNKQFDIWELHTTAPDDSYSDLASFSGIQNMAVVLYLEQFSKEDALCNKLTCDNQGIEQINTLRVLLIKTDDLKSTLAKDTIYTDNNWYELTEVLNHIAVPRDIVTINENSDESDFAQLKQIYQNVLEDGTLKETIKTDLNNILKRSGKTELGNNFDVLFETTKNNTLQDFQYRYDALKDIVATYNELQELLLHINFNCCPNIGSFPKHIMLGSLNINASEHELRHQFYEASIIGKSKENWQQLQYLLDRVLLLVNNYILLAPDNAAKITPSLSIAKLGQKAVPAYYNVSNNLLNSWNFKKTLNSKQTTNLSYHTTNLLDHPAIKEPLKYGIDDFNFFRIEGIHGKNYRTALDEVQKLRNDYGLNFDVKILKLSLYNDAINLNEYESMFRDLQLSLLLWQKDLNCTLALATVLLSSFSTEDVGGNASVNIKDVTTAVAATPDKTVAKDYGLTADIYSSAKYSKANTYLEEMYYYANTTRDVEESISKESKTIGAVLNEILKDKKGVLSAEELKAELEKQILPLVDTDEWNQFPSIKDIAISQPIEILAYIYDFSSKVPTTLVDLTEAKVNAFNTSLEKICELNEKYKAQYDQSDIADELKKDIGILITHLSAICCSGEKLDIIVAELNSRKTSILTQLQFKEYIKEHPGVRHVAGVPEGGTFIMVYLEESETGQSAYQPSKISFTFLEQPNIDDQGLDGDEGRIELWDKYISTNFAFIPQYVFGVTQNPIDEVVLIGKNLPETVQNFVTFLNNKWLRSGAEEFIKATIDTTDEVTVTIEINNQKIDKGENFIYFHNPAIIGKAGKTYFDENEEVATQIVGGNTVVADFALPYRCCGDGTSINYIIPKEPVFLSLPVPSICLKEDVLVDPLVFTVTPENAAIKAVVPEGIDAGVFVDEVTGETKLDVHQIDPSLLGTVIQFTANEEPTNCQIIVYPAVDISVNITSIVYNNDKSKANVTFTLIWGDADFENSDLANQLKYTWDYTDRGTFIEQAPDDNQFTNTYTLPINETNIITPRLQVSLGPCASVIPIEAIEFETLVPSELEIVSMFCFDFNNEIEEIDFININGEITIAGGAIDGLEIQDGKLIISAPDFQSFNQEISFLENGQPTNAQIIIYPIVNLNVTREVINYNDDKTEALVTFTLNLNNLGFENQELINEIVYEWDFLENGNFVAQNPDDNQFTNRYTLPINESNTITPKLRVSLGGCVNNINITPIVFETLTPSELGIIASFCFDINIREIEEINFTNVNGEITISGGAIDGLEIQDETLIITGGAFQSFEQNIRFLEDGQETNAQITIHEVKEISIGEGTTDRYFWQGTTLMYEANLQSNLPPNTNTNGINYTWASSDGQTGSSENFNPIVELSQTGNNSFGITLTILDENGCTAEATFTKVIAYPNFEIQPTGLQLCIDDETPTTINVIPNLEGTTLTGNGVSFDSVANEWQFIPRNSGLTTAGSVTINLVGNNASLFVNLGSEPVASFTDVLDEENGILVLTNTSQGAESAEWNITDDRGQKIDFEDDKVITLNLKDHETTSFNVVLEVINNCGSDSETRNIPVVSCIDETSSIINTDYGFLSEFLVDNFTNESPASLIALASATNSFYEDVRKEFESTLNGSRNAEIFSEEAGVNSLPNLLKASIDLMKADLDISLVKSLYIAQVKIFFNSIHCQVPKIWEGGFGSIVKEIINGLDLSILAENNSFKAFMMNYADGLNPQDELINDFVEALLKA